MPGPEGDSPRRRRADEKARKPSARRTAIGQGAGGAGVSQSGQLVAIAISERAPWPGVGGGGVAIDFGQSRRQVAQRGLHPRLIERAAMGQADRAIIDRDACAPQPPRHPPGPPAQQRPPGRVRWNTHRAHAMARTRLQDRPGNHRVQVKMLMRIDVIKRQAGLGKGGELRCHLGAHLRARAPRKRDVQGGAQHRGVEPPVAPD